MNRRAPVVPVIAAPITGAALFASRSVLDQFVGTDSLIRVAFVPPWWHLSIDIVLGAVLVFALERVARRSSLPLIGLAVLVVPFLPVLPARWPGLQIFSGPLTPIVWLGLRRSSRGGFGSRRGRRGAGVVAASRRSPLELCNFVIAGWWSEPHYLVIAQSLWRDHGD
jgi:hypothetical protein